MAIPMRGLRNLKTLSGRADQTHEPYRAYMQITCLEMERARRGAERRSASRRVAEIDARIAQIEREKQKLMARIEQAGQARPAMGRLKIRYGGGR